MDQNLMQEKVIHLSLVPQIELHPTRCQYPFINYLNPAILGSFTTIYSTVLLRKQFFLTKWTDFWPTNFDLHKMKMPFQRVKDICQIHTVEVLHTRIVGSRHIVSVGVHLTYNQGPRHILVDQLTKGPLKQMDGIA